MNISIKLNWATSSVEPDREIAEYNDFIFLSVFPTPSDKSLFECKTFTAGIHISNCNAGADFKEIGISFPDIEAAKSACVDLLWRFITPKNGFNCELSPLTES